MSVTVLTVEVSPLLQTVQVHLVVQQSYLGQAVHYRAKLRALNI